MAKEIFEIDPNMLKEHEKASALIPEMSDKEWGDFFENVQEVGIRQPLDINTNYEVLDGRHRLRAAKKLGLYSIKVIQHELTEAKEMEFVRDTALKRRNLDEATRTHLVLEAETLIKNIYEEGKKKRKSTLKKGHELPFSYADENGGKPHNSVKEIAEIAGVSHPYVSRVKKIKKENPEAFDSVLKGEKGVWTVYNDLPSVKENKGKIKGRKTERGDTDVKEVPSVVKKRMKKQNSTGMSEEQIKKEMFKANISTFFRHLTELEGFVGRTENFEGVVKESVKKDSASMKDYKNALKKIISLMEEYQ